MSGIYIHIPFCASRCRYCDFYSTTLLDYKYRYVQAVRREIEIRKDYLPNDDIQTIYFGGGTPSQVHPFEIDIILLQLKTTFNISPDAEITIEANPSDLNQFYLYFTHLLGFNRLSLGVQSFNDKHLQLLGRRHTASEVLQVVRMAREEGYDNISIDLIYGIPGQTLADWQTELEQALALNPEHISAYCLTYEAGTPLTKMLEKGDITAADDELLNQMYALLCKMLKDNGYEHYEVSNFAKPNRHSRHNSSYWNFTPYLGLGAAAHSFNGTSRQWNKSDIMSYMEEVEKGKLQPQVEILTPTDVYNERVMLGLRTSEGIDLNLLTPKEQAYCIDKAQSFLQTHHLELTDHHLRATTDGINILNHITEHLITLSS